MNGQANWRSACKQSGEQLANKLENWLSGNQQFFNFFIGRDEAVDDALRAVKMASPRPPAR